MDKRTARRKNRPAFEQAISEYRGAPPCHTGGATPCFSANAHPQSETMPCAERTRHNEQNEAPAAASEPVAHPPANSPARRPRHTPCDRPRSSAHPARILCATVTSPALSSSRGCLCSAQAAEAIKMARSAVQRPGATPVQHTCSSPCAPPARRPPSSAHEADVHPQESRSSRASARSSSARLRAANTTRSRARTRRAASS